MKTDLLPSEVTNLPAPGSNYPNAEDDNQHNAISNLRSPHNNVPNIKNTTTEEIILESDMWRSLGYKRDFTSIRSETKT